MNCSTAVSVGHTEVAVGQGVVTGQVMLAGITVDMDVCLDCICSFFLAGESDGSLLEVNESGGRLTVSCCSLPCSSESSRAAKIR